MHEVVDVAIVGLGPVGAVLAALLGRAGIRTSVIDKSDDIFPLPRAVAFDHEIMRVLQNLGLAEPVSPYIMPYRPTEYRGMGGATIARYESLPPPYPQGWEPSFVFTQPPFERAIRAAVAQLPTAEVRLFTELRGLTQHADCVALDVVGQSGTA
jgi:3-(3-hydroxy-phenyl)propionate hydroxylase